MDPNTKDAQGSRPAETSMQGDRVARAVLIPMESRLP